VLEESLNNFVVVMASYYARSRSRRPNEDVELDDDSEFVRPSVAAAGGPESMSAELAVESCTGMGITVFPR